MSADNLAKFLGVEYRQRQRLGLTTIGSTDVKKHDRKIIRWYKNKMAMARKRLERGAQPQSQSLLRTKPWEVMNMSRATVVPKTK